jgi:hypothetical protein
MKLFEVLLMSAVRVITEGMSTSMYGAVNNTLKSSLARTKALLALFHI